MNRKQIIEAAKRRKKCNLPHKDNWTLDALDTDWQKYIMDIIRLENERTSSSFEASYYFLKNRAVGVYYNDWLENEYAESGYYDLAFKYIVNNCYGENSVVEMVMENE